MNHSARRIIMVQLSRTEVVDGRITLTLNTDLNAHAYLSSIPNGEINRVLGEVMEDLVIKLDKLKNQHGGIVE